MYVCEMVKYHHMYPTSISIPQYGCLNYAVLVYEQYIVCAHDSLVTGSLWKKQSHVDGLELYAHIQIDAACTPKDIRLCEVCM